MFIMTNNSVNYVPCVYQGAGTVGVILIRSLIIARHVFLSAVLVFDDQDADFPESFPTTISCPRLKPIT